MSMQNETTCLSTDELRQILQNFNRIQKISTEKNFFDIVYKKRYENNISDILVFFLDSNEEHGFGSTILECLLSAIQKNLSKRVNSDSLDILKNISTSLGSYTVGREEITGTGKYIDIVVEGDDWVIAIENKIWAKANNPFDDYVAHIINKEKDKKLFILLKPYFSQDDKIDNWINLLYENIIEEFEEIFKKLYVEQQNNKWNIFFSEFIRYIKDSTF